MQIFAHHDAAGAISSFVAVETPEGVRVGLTPNPGQSVVEVEGLQLKSAEPDVEELREIAMTHTVGAPQQRGRLVKKGEPGKKKKA